MCHLLPPPSCSSYPETAEERRLLFFGTSDVGPADDQEIEALCRLSRWSRVSGIVKDDIEERDESVCLKQATLTSVRVSHRTVHARRLCMIDGLRKPAKVLFKGLHLAIAREIELGREQRSYYCRPPHPSGELPIDDEMQVWAAHI